MVVGDAVNSISDDNTILDFQPASGVECVIVSYGLNGVNNAPLIYNGTNTSSFSTGNGELNDSNSNLNLRVNINNTNYLRLPALGAGNRSFYTGITTK